MDCRFLKRAALPDNAAINYDRTFKRCEALSDIECDLNNFCLSFRRSTEIKKNGDVRSALFDAFQATPFIAALYAKQSLKQCVVCGARIGSGGICSRCGAKHPDLAHGFLYHMLIGY